MENTLNSRKNRKISSSHTEVPYIVQMFIIYLRNWIIPFKLSKLLVMHDRGKLSRVGELSLAERLQGR